MDCHAARMSSFPLPIAEVRAAGATSEKREPAVCYRRFGIHCARARPRLTPKSAAAHESSHATATLQPREVHHFERPLLLRAWFQNLLISVTLRFAHYRRNGMVAFSGTRRFPPRDNGVLSSSNVSLCVATSVPPFSRITIPHPTRPDIPCLYARLTTLLTLRSPLRS